MAGQKTKSKKPTVLVGKPWTRDELQIVRGQRVVVGKPWKADEIEIREAKDRQARTRMVLWLGAFFAAISAVVLAYALIERDSSLISELLKLGNFGLLAVLGWAGGPRLLKMVSGLRFEDPDEKKR